MKKNTCRPASGPGGVKCFCCFPAPGTRERRYRFKKARRAVDKLELKEGLTDANIPTV